MRCQNRRRSPAAVPAEAPRRRAALFGSIPALGKGFGLLLLGASLAAAATAEAGPASSETPAVSMAAKISPSPPIGLLDPLLIVPDLMPLLSDAQRTDDSLAAAVKAGSNPDLEKVSAFRKRSTDLFRTERPVEIGQREMLLRLRLRAKTRRAMSVELRF